MYTAADILSYIGQFCPEFRVRLIDFLSEKMIDGIIENKQERRKARIGEVRFFGILFEFKVIRKSNLFPSYFLLNLPPVFVQRIESI
jgi:hypothetical protein